MLHWVLTFWIAQRHHVEGLSYAVDRVEVNELTSDESVK